MKRREENKKEGAAPILAEFYVKRPQATAFGHLYITLLLSSEVLQNEVYVVVWNTASAVY